MQQEIIEEVGNEATTWISPLVIVPKNSDPDAVRICVDMTQPNKAIARVRCALPTVDELLTNMEGAQYFSRIDLASAYHQLVLEDESKHVTTFATHKGTYRYPAVIEE